MARSRELKVALIGDPSSLNRALASVEKRAGHFGGALSTAAKVGAAAFGGALVLGVKSAVDAFAESERVQAQTTAVLKSTGAAANVTAKQVTDLATAVSKKTGIDDEAVQAQENLLLTFTKVRNEAGKNNDIFTQATGIVTDLATSMNNGALPSMEQMNSSSIKIGKALNDPVKGLTALTKVGVTFTEGQKKQVTALEASGHHLEAQKIVLKELKTEFGGAAEAAGNTFSGKIAKAKVAVGNLEEAIGGQLVPVISAGADALTGLVDKLTTSDRPAKFFSSIAGAAGSARDAIAGVFKGIGDKRAGGATLGKAIGDTFAEAVGDINWGGIGDKIAVGVGGAIKLGGDITKQVQDGMGAALSHVDGRKLLSGLLRVVSEGINALFSPSFWIDNFKNIFATVTIAIPVAKILKIPGAAALYNFLSKPLFGALRKLGGGLVSAFGKIAVDGGIGFLSGLEKLAPRTANLLLGLVTGSGKWLAGLPGKFKSAGSRAIGGIVSAIGGGVGKVTGAIGGLVGHVIGPLEKLGSRAFNAGKSAIGSLINGLKSITPHFDISLNPLHPHFRVTFGGGGKATGGLIAGSGRGDIVPTMLEPGEYVIQRKVVEKFGPTYFAALNSGQQPQQFAGGGVVGPGTVSKMQSAARGWLGLPYVYGGGHGSFGPSGGGFDCSGFVSAVLGVGGAIGSPMAVRQPLQSALLPGPGKYVTVGIRGSSGKNAHTMIKVGSRYFESASRGVVESGGWRGAFDLFHPRNEATSGGAAEDPGQATGSGGGSTSRTASAERSGSRLVNKITGATAKVVSTATRAASAIGGVIDQADSGYGRTERLYGQVLGGVPGAFGEEDLGTATGRAQRTTELQQLKSLKKDQLSRLKKRMAALSKAIAAREKTLKSLRKARDKAHGAKRAKISARLKPYEDRTIELKAELEAVGGSVSDTELDIGDLDKEIQDVAATPDNAADTQDAGPSTTDEISRQLAHIDALERAGDITPADAQQYRINTIQQALAGKFGSLTDEETLNLRGDLKDATSALTQATVDNTQALKDLQGSIDAQLQFANGVLSITSAEALRLMVDTLSGQFGTRVAARSAMPGSGALSRL